MNLPHDAVIDAKVKPIVEQAMQKYLGIRVSDIEADITDQLKRSTLLDIPIDSKLPFKAAKKAFKRAYLMRLLHQHLGNISTAADVAGIDRRSIHRLVLSLRVPTTTFRKDAQPQYARNHHMVASPQTAVGDIRQATVQGILQNVLENYRAALNPIKYNAFSAQAEAISDDITKELPEEHLTLKAAEQAFEYAYFRQLMKESTTVVEAAKKARLRYEVLHRKLKSIGITAPKTLIS